MTPGPDPSSSPTTHSLVSGKCPVAGGRDGGAALQQGLPILPPYMVANPRNSMSITNTKGLLNMPGQNNCFLNSAVQVLWHLDIFRRSFRELNGHACMAESCIFCALKELFAQFQYSQESALPPDALRRALAETFCDQRRFQLGFMDDAAECFENILLRIHFHIANKESEDMCNANHCIPHQKFAMTLVEQTVCHACGATSEPLPFTQMVHYVPSSALCSQAKVLRSEKGDLRGFGELLKKAGGLGDLRDCPSSCGTVIQIRKTLMNKPEIVSIGLVWDSERPTIDHIMDVFSTIGMTLKLQDVFHSVVDSRWAASATHQLVGIVTYYGKHYSTFFFHTKLRVWIYFDDAAVREIGPKWEQVVEKCYRGHFQPLLLLYANPYGTSISTSTAPHDVTVVSNHKKVFSCKDINGVKMAEKLRQNSHSVENQRRAVTPNPEASCDINANIQPRRAVTPSGEIIRPPDSSIKCVSRSKIGENVKENGLFHGPSLNITSGLDRNAGQIYSVSNYLAYKHELWQNKYLDANLENPGAKCDVEEKARCIGDQCWSFLTHSPSKCSTSSDSSIIMDKNKDGNNIPLVPTFSTDENVRLVNTCKPPVSNTTRLPMHGTIESEVNVRSDVYEEDRNSEKTYISRKTVENVLHLQKLQRQKSVNAKHAHACISQRNSDSSLESLENIYLAQDKGIDNFLGLKFDISESINMPRKRDSGNWSGDRNSASSSSTTSLDNPYFYSSGNKRPVGNTRSFNRSTVLDSVSSTDPGYDSFSLSSSDSYPSVIAFSSGKVDPRLGLILENQQTAFMPHMPQIQHCIQDFNKNEEGHSYGFRDECEKLCIEADIFLAKSVERENIGDISMAALLSDSAAAKARAAMDVPYSSPHSLSLAKLKHSTCIIRSSSLHAKLKESVVLEQQRREHACKPHKNYDPSHEFKNPEPNSPQKSEKQSHVNMKDFHKLSMSHKYSEGQGSTEKAIEIYATLPKKSLRKKTGLMSFVESLTSDDNSSEKSSKQKSSDSLEEKMHSNHSFPSDTANSQISPLSHWKNTNSEVLLGMKSSRETNKKKSYIFSKSVNKDSDLSDSMEWDHGHKNSLYRTYSGPPSHDNGIVVDSVDENQALSSHSPKKPHKIRRKLMGGFMRRKNRSLPDLREGQDQANGLSRSFDDCAITQNSIPIKNLNEKNSREVQSVSPNMKTLPTSSKLPSEILINKQPSVVTKCDDTSVKYPQNINSFNIATSPNQGFRANTPPPYKPPPPIAGSVSELEKSHNKRISSHGKEIYNKNVTTSLNIMKPNSACSTITVESIKKPQLVGKSGSKVQTDNGSKASTINTPVSSPKQNGNYLKIACSHDLPKGSAIWLKELQLKQEELILKKKVQQEKLKQQNHLEKNVSSGHLLAFNEQIFEGRRNEFTPKSFSINCDQDISNMLCSFTDNSTNQSTANNMPSQQTSNGESDQLNSVKYLASRFENIIKPASDISDSFVSHCTENGSIQSGIQSSVTLSCSSDSKNSFSVLNSELGDRTQLQDSQSQPDNSKNCQKDKDEECLTKLPTPHSTSSYIYNSYLTDGQLTNMLHIGTNCASFRSGNVKVVNSKEVPHSSSLNSSHKEMHEARRPDKPPDYETAIQRLELIRGDRNLLKHLDLSTLEFEHDKKKVHSSKKSVTFSDKVVLVACAGDEDNDFLPNPLFERVYKQHLLQKPAPDSCEKSTTQDAQCLLENSNHCSTAANLDSSKPSLESSQVSCNLCHSKLVLLPNIYCPDCAFYMSRFQK